MRTLTITREKKSIACLSKIKVYVEDWEYGDVNIANVPCRKIGTLKNGETKSFEITDKEVKIFTISGKSSKNISSDYYQLSEGTEDVYLSGENYFSLFTGNAYRFHNNNDEGAKENRRRGTKKGTVTFVVAIIVGVIIGAISGSMLSAPQEMVYKCDDMQLTLTDEFEEIESQTHLRAVASRDIALIIDKDPFDLVPELKGLSERKYASLVISSYGISATSVLSEDNLTYFTYTNDVDGITYTYYAFAYKTDNAFWLLQFAATNTKDGKAVDKIMEYAKSVTFE